MVGVSPRKWYTIKLRGLGAVWGGELASPLGPPMRCPVPLGLNFALTYSFQAGALI